MQKLVVATLALFSAAVVPTVEEDHPAVFVRATVVDVGSEEVLEHGLRFGPRPLADGLLRISETQAVAALRLLQNSERVQRLPAIIAPAGPRRCVGTLAGQELHCSVTELPPASGGYLVRVSGPVVTGRVETAEEIAVVVDDGPSDWVYGIRGPKGALRYVFLHLEPIRSPRASSPGSAETQDYARPGRLRGR